MNILILTNTYLPHVGGVARSVAAFEGEFRRRGDEVLVVTPTFPGARDSQPGVLRVPAIEHFNRTDFSFPLPFHTELYDAVAAFQPDIVHSQHPFLLGDTALRIGAWRNIPVVFTHHTQYEQYTHYIAEAELTRHFVVELVSGYCNLCDAVVAPSETIAGLLLARGVTTEIATIPTGVDAEWMRGGEGAAGRRRHGVPLQAFVVGHVGRLAPEKNLLFLAGAVAQYLQQNAQAWFVVAGVGPMDQEIRRVCAEAGVSDRLAMAGVLSRDELRDFYHAMNVFAFASQSETQGLVLAEAMAAGVPVVAVDAPGVREVMRDGENGRMLPREDAAEFVAALAEVAKLDLRAGALATAAEFSLPRCADRMLALYEQTIERRKTQLGPPDFDSWTALVRRLEEEGSIWTNYALALGNALVSAVIGESDE